MLETLIGGATFSHSLGGELTLPDLLLLSDRSRMHPFPDASELQFLVGCELEQICLGQWQIQFNFDFARVSVEGALEHVDKTGAVWRHDREEGRLLPIRLHYLFGQKVERVEAQPFRLTVAFNGGDTLCIFSDDGPYECGQIYDKDGMVTVF